MRCRRPPRPARVLTPPRACSYIDYEKFAKSAGSLLVSILDIRDQSDQMERYEATRGRRAELEAAGRW